MKITQTGRGFPFVAFVDRYNKECSLQISSLADDRCVWLGIEHAEPKIMASVLRDGLTGWVDYPIPEDVHINTRMHLTQEQVAELIPHLQQFVDTGEI
jgi:hypothetical protein